MNYLRQGEVGESKRYTCTNTLRGRYVTIVLHNTGENRVLTVCELVTRGCK